MKLKGRRAWDATFSPWLARQLDHEYVTYLDWAALRELRGLAKRLWIYVEAERVTRRSAFSPRRSWVTLSPKARDIGI